MEDFKAMKNIDPTEDIEMRSPSYGTPSPFKPACWPTSPVPVPLTNSKAPIPLQQSPTLSEFPPLLPTPLGPPLRVQRQLPALHSLDIKQLSASSFLRNISGSNSQDDLQGQAITNPSFKGIESARNETQNSEAIKQLVAHINERSPYVHLASSRLQAALRIRNEIPFNIPQEVLPNPVPKNMRRASAGMNITTDTGGKTTFKACGRVGVRAAGSSTKKPMKMHTVDEQTGKGLREFLIEKGKERGQKKIKCTSVSIHDFTPDMRTLAHQNVLLCHFDTEKGARADAYEVDLPTVTTDQETGEVTNGSETWLWILIQRPIVSFDESDTSTQIQEPRDLDAPATAGPANPPPNFPTPIPLSWMIFAAPLAHLTAYPETIEKVPDSLRKLKWGGKSKMVHKRVDYDFSCDGVPLFEFSSGGLFQGHRTDFLSVENMGRFCTGDGYRSYSEEEYNYIYQEWLEDGGIEGGGFGKIPCPNEGVWWAEFYKRVGEDCDTWQKVKTAMEMGKCRVVLRWVEYDDEAEGEDGDGDVGLTTAPEINGTNERANGEVARRNRGGVYEMARRITNDPVLLYSPRGMIPSPIAPREKTAFGRIN